MDNYLSNSILWVGNCVSPLSGLPIRKLFQDCKAAAEKLFRADRVNELYRDLRVMMIPLRDSQKMVSKSGRHFKHHLEYKDG
jgi:hypothetical protein